MENSPVSNRSDAMLVVGWLGGCGYEKGGSGEEEMRNLKPPYFSLIFSHAGRVGWRPGECGGGREGVGRPITCPLVSAEIDYARLARGWGVEFSASFAWARILLN